MNKFNQYKDSLVGLPVEKITELLTYKAVERILAEPKGLFFGGRCNSHVEDWYESHIDYSVYNK